MFYKDDHNFEPAAPRILAKPKDKKHQQNYTKFITTILFLGQ